MKTKIIYLPLLLLFAVLSWSCGTEKTTTEHKEEVYAEVPYAVGNIAFNYKGELVYSHHPFYDNDIRVVHYNDSTKQITPFPNIDWNTPKKDNENYLSVVLGIRNDDKGVIWMLDMGIKNNITPKFVGWNTITNSLEKIYPIPVPASLKSSQLNDFVIDTTHKIFIIADEEIGPGGNGLHGALVLVDMVTGKARRVLDGHYSTIPENKPLVFNGKTLMSNNKPLLIGADGITADKNNEWLYYAPLNSSKVYRIKIQNLIDVTLSADELGKKVETYSSKDNNGGISIDEDNNLYLTYLESNGIGIIPSDTKQPYLYASDSLLLWPDGVSYNKDGYLYSSAAQIQSAASFNNGVDKTIKPFRIYRVKPLTKGIFGR